MIKRFVLLFSLVAFCAVDGFSFFDKSADADSTSPINIEADHLEFHKENNILFAVGNVRLAQEGFYLKTDSIIIYMDQERLEAEGNVLFDQDGSVMYGESFQYSWNTSTGTMHGGSGQEGYWLYNAGKMDKISEDRVKVYRAKFTSCDSNPPHYYVYGRSATIKLKKWLVIKNAFLVVDTTPVFYTPFFFKSLKEKKISIRIRPAYSKYDGITILSEIGIPTSDNTHLKLLIDYFDEKGEGYGAEFSYYTDNAKGSIYGYQITETDKKEKTTRERWNFLMNHWQKHEFAGKKTDDTNLARREPELISQAQLEFQSDTNFNNDYFKESYKRVNQDLRGNTAFTYNNDIGTTRLSFDRRDVYDQDSDEFNTAYITAPRLDFFISRRKILNLPLYVNYSNYFQRYYTGSGEYYQNSAGANTGISNDVRLTRNNTFTHAYSWSQSWAGKVDNVAPKDIYQARYYVDLYLRNRLTYFADLDFAHGYTVRMRPNSTIQDTQAFDKGIERNFLSSFLIIRPNRHFTSRTTAGYNFHRRKDEKVEKFADKMGNISEEINWNVPGKLNHSYFARSSYSPANNYMESLQLGYSMVPSHLYSLGVDSSYNKASRGDAVFSARAKFKLFEYWYLRGSLGFKVEGPKRMNYDTVDFYDRELKIVRDMHCFIFETLYRKRGMREEIQFNLLAKFEYLKRQRIDAKMRTYEFYPWREE